MSTIRIQHLLQTRTRQEDQGIVAFITDIKDPKIDEKPPPYECSSCGYSTWSWNEAKHHICLSRSQLASRGALAESKDSGHYQQLLSGRKVEEIVHMTLKAREDHPDWSEDRIIQSIIKSFESNKTHN